MFRFVIGALAVVGLYGLLSGTMGAAAQGVGVALALPIVLFKLAIIVMIFGFVGATMRGGSPWIRRRRHGRWNPTDPPVPSGRERFEEWHRLAHARDEVDGWVEGIGVDERE